MFKDNKPWELWKVNPGEIAEFPIYESSEASGFIITITQNKKILSATLDGFIDIINIDLQANSLPEIIEQFETKIQEFKQILENFCNSEGKKILKKIEFVKEEPYIQFIEDNKNNEFAFQGGCKIGFAIHYLGG